MALIKLYAGDSMLAHHLCGLLEQARVKATVMGDTLGAARGDIPVTIETMPSVWIDERDAERAKPILERFVRGGKGGPSDAPDPPPWPCPQCDEQIERQFTNCWNCGAARPDLPPPLPEA